MTKATQKEFDFHLPISDDEIWGIGLVVCHWASLEDFLDNFIAYVNKGPALTSAGAPMSFKSRIKLLREIIEREVISAAHQVFLIELLSTILAIQNERDKVMHHVWTQAPDGSKTIFDWRQKSTPSERPVSFNILVKLAHKIDAARASLLDFLITSGNVQPGSPGHPMQPLFATAWPKISRAP